MSLGHLCLAELTVVPRGGGRGAVLSLGPPQPLELTLFSATHLFFSFPVPAYPDVSPLQVAGTVWGEEHLPSLCCSPQTLPSPWRGSKWLAFPLL